MTYNEKVSSILSQLTELQGEIINVNPDADDFHTDEDWKKHDVLTEADSRISTAVIALVKAQQILLKAKL